MTLDAFSILARDFSYALYRSVRKQRRNHEGFLQSKRLNSWLTKIFPGSKSTGQLVADFTDYGCVDTRDRVFALLVLSRDNAHSATSIRPDYTKSTFEVLLQLLKQETHGVREKYNSTRYAMEAMEMTVSIVGGFHLGPLAAEIADNLQLRRSAHATPTPPSQELVLDNHSLSRIKLYTNQCSRVWKDEAGNMLTSLLKDKEYPSPIFDHDPQYVQQYIKDIAVEVRNSLGDVVAFADRKLKAGDFLLFFRDLGPSGGLIVRPIKSGFHIIVGQVVLNHGIRPRSYRSHSHRSRPCFGIDENTFDRENERWWVYMSPLDLILFVAQDMKSEISSSEVGHIMKRTVCLEDSVKRLTTNVTSDLDSSFAVLLPRELEHPSDAPRIILKSHTIDFP